MGTNKCTGAAVARGLGLSGAREASDMNPSTQPSALPDGVWQTLLAHAFTLVDEIARRRQRRAGS